MQEAGRDGADRGLSDVGLVVGELTVDGFNEDQDAYCGSRGDLIEVAADKTYPLLQGVAKRERVFALTLKGRDRGRAGRGPHTIKALPWLLTLTFSSQPFSAAFSRRKSPAYAVR